MNTNTSSPCQGFWPKLALMPTPAKALATTVIFTMAIAMVGALGQIVVHDIIPTFFIGKESEGHGIHAMKGHSPSEITEPHSSLVERGDLFADEPLEEKPAEAFYKTEQFVWTLKWTHIHLFGMSMIFLFMGAITLFLNLNSKARTWLIILPFIGVLIDIASMWLKGYISSAFFWLHLPGGCLFGTVFIIVSTRALWEMWWAKEGA